MSENQQIDLQQEKKQSFLNRAWWPFLAGVLFASVYFLSYKIIDPSSVDLDNFKILDIFSKYGQWFGFGLAFLALLWWYILYALKNLLRLSKWIVLNPIVYLLGLSMWGALAYQFWFREPRFTNIAKAIIDYVAQPLWYTFLFLAVVGGLWLLFSIFYILFKKSK